MKEVVEHFESFIKTVVAVLSFAKKWAYCKFKVPAGPPSSVVMASCSSSFVTEH
jgi:hypothetical protein